VLLYWQRWNLASPLLEAASTAVRDEAATSLRPHEEGRPQQKQPDGRR